MKFKILSDSLLHKYINSLDKSFYEKFEQFENRILARNDFQYMLTVSSVFSSKIEGNSLDLDSFFVAKDNKINTKEVIEINDLIAAYTVAETATLNEANHLAMHKLLSRHFKILLASQKGKYRKSMVGIRSSTGLVYLAVEPEFVKQEMGKLWHDIDVLNKATLTTGECFYYAAYIHFIFAKIHPFADGNGRAARLLEKWFLATKLGTGVWGIQSEFYYWQHRAIYYKTINIGSNYYDTLEHLNMLLPFLSLLPKSIS